MIPGSNILIILGEIKLIEDEILLMQKRLEYLKGLIVKEATVPTYPRDDPYNPVVTVYSCPSVPGVWETTGQWTVSNDNDSQEWRHT